MDSEATTTAETTDTSEISPTAYGTFIGQIELVAIWLQSARVVNHYGPSSPERAEVNLNSHARWEPADDVEPGFQVFHTYEATIGPTEAPQAEIEVTFGLRFTSQQAMTEPIFRVFEAVNLPINTWPYLREYVATTIGRMNWLPLTLPALKRGTPPVRRSPARRLRRPRASTTN
jgi:hypothetical protein